MINDIENLINDALYDFENDTNNKEDILIVFSHNLLKYVVLDVENIMDFIFDKIATIDNIYIKERLIFQYFDCLFRKSTSWPIDVCIQELRTALDRLFDYRDQPSYIMYMGAYYLLQGERSKAFQQMYESSVKAKDYYGVPRMYLGSNSIKTTCEDWVNSEKRLPAIFPVLQEANIKVEKIVAKNQIVLLSADSKYFKNFKNYIIQNLSELQSETLLHFHVVDWDKSFQSIKIPANLAFKIGLSSEDYRYLRDRTYFATSRFYRALEIMELYQSDLYISDIDNKFICNPSIFFEQVKGYDIGLRFNKNGHWFPWWGPSAGSFYAANTKYGRVFLRHLKEYISERFKVNQSKYTWWFDQLALNEVYEYCHNTYPEMKFVNLTEPQYFLSVARNRKELGGLK